MGGSGVGVGHGRLRFPYSNVSIECLPKWQENLKVFFSRKARQERREKKRRLKTKIAKKPLRPLRLCVSFF